MKNKKEIKERIEKAKEKREEYKNAGVVTDNWYKGYLKALRWVLEEGEEKWVKKKKNLESS